MNLDIPAEHFGSLIGAAVMQAVTQENRDTLIKEAITHLLSSTKDYTGRSRSPLQAAFDYAVQDQAKAVIGQTLDGMLADKVKSVVEEALMKAFEDDRKKKMIDSIADAIVKGFAFDNRY